MINIDFEWVDFDSIFTPEDLQWKDEEIKKIMLDKNVTYGKAEHYLLNGDWDCLEDEIDDY